MSVEHTIVVRFDDGAELPAYSSATEFMGGRVVAVDFCGNRLDVADDLLEALEMCISSMESLLPDFNPFDQAAYDKARAAIAKAGGAA